MNNEQQTLQTLLDHCNAVIDTYSDTLEVNHGGDLDFMLVWDNFVEFVKGDTYVSK